MCDKVSKATIALNNVGVTDSPNESDFRSYKEASISEGQVWIEHFQVQLANRENFKDVWLLTER